MIIDSSGKTFAEMWFKLRNEFYKTLTPESLSLPTIQNWAEQHEKYMLEVHKVKFNYGPAINGNERVLQSIELLMDDEEAVAFLVRWS